MASAFLLSAVAGFAYAHDPTPPVVHAVLERTGAPPPSDVRGTIASVDADAIEVVSTDGPRRLATGPAMPIEALVPTQQVLTGIPGLVGGNRTENGFVLTGVVVLEPTR